MMLDTSRNVNIFPNLVLIDIQFGIQIRTVWPLAPGHTQITGWQLTPADSTDAVRRYRMENSRTFWGPAGLATPDDVEALEQCQRGFEAEREVGWSESVPRDRGPVGAQRTAPANASGRRGMS